MIRMKLRTKFLLASLLISAGLTTACLYLVGRVIGAQARNGVVADVRNSIRTFQNLQQQRESARVRTAELLADLPIVRALMTTEDSRTIQDASRSVADLAEADIFVLADRSGRPMAVHSTVSLPGREIAAQDLRKSLVSDARTHWWYIDEHLFEVSVRPIYFGSSAEGRLLGYVAVGYEVNDKLIRELSEVAGSEVAFFHDRNVVRTTLQPAQRTDLAQVSVPLSETEMVLGGDRFVVDAVELNGQSNEHIHLFVLKSLDTATAALRNLRRWLTVTGTVAVAAGALLVFFISFTFTRPLRKLVEGVRALGRGDYEFALPKGGSDEVAELTNTFGRMRRDLRETQRELVEAEKLATIGRMASSISHDLRHQLVAILANAEFLVDDRRTGTEREELYNEVRAGVAEMNELLESLLEFSRSAASLHRSHCQIQAVVEHALQAARRHPEYREVPVSIVIPSDCEGEFDLKKLERVFQNLLLNALAAVARHKGNVSVIARRDNGRIRIRIADTGPGIPPEIRSQIFEPFFSYGKDNGTGLGLSVAQKIVQDHGGELSLEPVPAGCVFALSLPILAEVPVQMATNNV